MDFEYVGSIKKNMVALLLGYECLRKDLLIMVVLVFLLLDQFLQLTSNRVQFGIHCIQLGDQVTAHLQRLEFESCIP